MYQKNYKPKTRDNLLFKELDDGGVVFEPASEKCHSLNASSAYIWSLCDGTYTIEDILKKIKKDFTEFEIEPEKAVNDVISKFQDLNLLDYK